MPVKTHIRLRRDISSTWTSVNPTLLSGEVGYETDTGKLKIGDGSTLWANLAYTQVAINGVHIPIGGTSLSVTNTVTAAPTAHASTHAGAGSDPITGFGAVTATGTLSMGTNNITGTGTVSATTFSGQLSGTIASSTTATTQSPGDNSTKVATTAFVTAASSAAASSAVPTGAVFQWVAAAAPSGYLLCDGTARSRTTYADLYAVIGDTYGAGNGTTTFNVPNLQTRVPLGHQAPTSLGTATITIAAPGVVTKAAHGLSTGQIVYFTTTGALPTGLTASTRYWVIAVTSSTFRLATSQANALAGTAVTTSGTQSGTHTVFSADFDLGRSNGEINHEQTLTELATHNHTQSAHNHTIPNSVTVPGGTSFFNFESWSNGTDQSRTITTGNATPAIQNSGSGLAMNIMQPYLTMNFIIKT